MLCLEPGPVAARSLMGDSALWPWSLVVVAMSSAVLSSSSTLGCMVGAAMTHCFLEGGSHAPGLWSPVCSGAQLGGLQSQERGCCPPPKAPAGAPPPLGSTRG